MQNFFLRLLWPIHWDKPGRITPWLSEDAARAALWTSAAGHRGQSCTAGLGSGSVCWPGLDTFQQWVSGSTHDSQTGGMENCVHAARLTFSLRLIRRARGENWFTTKPVGRAFPSNPASVVNNHVQLLLCWGFPFLWPSILFPSPPICLFASGKWLCRYSQVQFQKVRLMKANCELCWGKSKLSKSVMSGCRSHGDTPSQLAAMLRQECHPQSTQPRTFVWVNSK